MLQIILMFPTGQRLNYFTFPNAGHEKANRNVKKTQSLPLLNFQQKHTKKMKSKTQHPSFLYRKPT